MTISKRTGEELVQILRDTAREEILPRYRRLSADSIRSKTTPTDLVTIADQRAEALIHKRVLDLMRGAEVVGEEAVSEDETLLKRIGEAETVVIVDPIDGTWNYAKGLPLFGVILAVVELGRTTFGVLYDPVMDDWIFAHDGQGAYYKSGDGRANRIGVRQAGDLQGMTGFLPLFLFSEKEQRVLASKLHEFDRVLSLRCSCHEYRLLAEGSADFGLSGMLKPWDHAAGELIYREAGGYAAMLDDGARYSPTMTAGQLLLAPDQKSWNALREHFRDIVT